MVFAQFELRKYFEDGFELERLVVLIFNVLEGGHGHGGELFFQGPGTKMGRDQILQDFLANLGGEALSNEAGRRFTWPEPRDAGLLLNLAHHLFSGLAHHLRRHFDQQFTLAGIFAQRVAPTRLVYHNLADCAGGGRSWRSSWRSGGLIAPPGSLPPGAPLVSSSMKHVSNQDSPRFRPIVDDVIADGKAPSTLVDVIAATADLRVCRQADYRFLQAQD